MNNGLGIADLEMWNEVYRPVLKSFDNIVPGSLKNFKVLSEEEEEEYFRLASRIQKLNRDSVTFKICLLIVLTKTGKGDDTQDYCRLKAAVGNSKFKICVNLEPIP